MVLIRCFDGSMWTKCCGPRGFPARIESITNGSEASYGEIYICAACPF